MIKSMTGFGRGEYASKGREYVVEIKTINHRYLDINIRLPRQYSFFEEFTRKEISKTISRGKVDINIQFSEFGNEFKQVLFDEELIKLYLSEAVSLEEKLGIKNDLSFCKAIQLPEVIKVNVSEDEEELIKEFSVALNCALVNLKEMREKEGNNLKNDLTAKCDNLLSLLLKIEEKSDTLVSDYKLKLKERIDDLLKDVNVQIDDSRLATEVAIYADKVSIDEEIVRFKSHIGQLKATLELDEPIGKKLDFIVQEMNRETNTIGSKANNLEISQNVIELKNEIEKIREQIQNIE